MFIRITQTERKVIKLLLLKNSQIAKIMVCALPTIKTHIHTLMIKFSASSRAEIILKALRNRVVFLDEIKFPNDCDLDEWYVVKGEDNDRELVGQVSKKNTQAYRECKPICKKAKFRIS